MKVFNSCNSSFVDCLTNLLLNFLKFIKVITANLNVDWLSCWRAILFFVNRNSGSWNSLNIGANGLQVFRSREVFTVREVNISNSYFAFVRCCNTIRVLRISRTNTNVRNYRFNVRIVFTNDFIDLILDNASYRICNFCISSNWHLKVYVGKVRFSIREKFHFRCRSHEHGYRNEEHHNHG